MRAYWGYGLQEVRRFVTRTVLERPAIESESLVWESNSQRAGSKVPRDTRNLVGIRGDHPPRLNTT